MAKDGHGSGQTAEGTGPPDDDLFDTIGAEFRTHKYGLVPAEKNQIGPSHFSKYLAKGVDSRAERGGVPDQVLDSGMELHDLLADADFSTRPLSPRDANREATAFKRLAKVFTESPEIILKKLVEIAIDLCDADSAGVSLEDEDDPTNLRFRWIAVAGSFSKYLNGTTPRHYSPCGTCLDAARPQHYRVFQPYYDFLGVVAEPILDGLLIPWENDSMRGTIWVVSHESREGSI